MEIKVKRDTSFRKQFFVPDSFAHPAKMDAQLLIWIVEHCTKEGEVILDPMAGSGTTMLACTLGRNCILVELEEKFCKMMRDNWEVVKMHPQLGSTIGDCQVIQGDARQLGGLLVDKIVTSPPFAEAQSGGGIAKKGYQGPKHGPTDLVGKRSYMPENIGNSEGQIGNLPYGQIDKIVTSPPYEGSEARDRSKEDWWDEEREKRFSGGSLKIAKGYSGVDSIITSPPYEGMKQDDKRANDPEQIDKRAREFEKAGGDFHTPGRMATIARHYAGYTSSSDNIGNLKSESYLEAMLQVYQQCHSVLKPQGLMILVTKNFIRNKQVVRLDTDTIKLCEQAGFIFVERHYRKLPSQSFWRIIYHQKYPGVEQINYEDILVLTK